MMDPAALLGEYAEAKNQHDVEGMLARTHPECRYEEVGNPRTATGHAELRALHDELFAALPDYAATMEGIAASGDTAVAWGRFTATLTRPLRGHGRAGDHVDIAAVFVCAFRDGLLHHERAHLDLASLRQQLTDPAHARGDEVR